MILLTTAAGGSTSPSGFPHSSMVGRNVVAGVLSNSNEQVRRADGSKLVGKPFNVERVNLAIPSLGGEF